MYALESKSYLNINCLLRINYYLIKKRITKLNMRVFVMPIKISKIIIHLNFL